MPMRHIKPQAALIATARTQIGATPMLAISIGVGFRLSDPTILVHEAAVWEALKAATPSVPLAEVAMPKRCAEWLLAGESVHRITAADHRGMVEWNASVELDGVRKTVSCRVKANPGSAPDAFARLTIDPVQAAAGGPEKIRSASCQVRRHCSVWGCWALLQNRWPRWGRSQMTGQNAGNGCPPGPARLRQWRVTVRTWDGLPVSIFGFSAGDTGSMVASRKLDTGRAFRTARFRRAWRRV